MQNKPAIGVIGLGIMGMAIAKNAKKAGFDVGVTNRSTDKRTVAEKENFRVFGSPKEVTQHADIVITMVTDPAAVRAVLSGDNGVFSATNLKGKVLIQMSTIDEASTVEFANAASERGMEFLDCPVAGSKKQVEEAQLILLAGGDSSLLDRCSELFNAIGKAVVHAGGVGKGSALKLCMNLIVAQMTTALCESVSLAEAQSVNPAKIFEVLSHSPALNCGYFKIKEKALLEQNFSPAFSLNNMLKDVRFMDVAAKTKRLNIPVTQAVKYLMEAAVAAGHGEEDLTSISSVLKPATTR